MDYKFWNDNMNIIIYIIYDINIVSKSWYFDFFIGLYVMIEKVKWKLKRWFYIGINLFSNLFL